MTIRTAETHGRASLRWAIPTTLNRNPAYRHNLINNLFMKRFLIPALLTIAFAQSAHAQMTPEEREERLRAHRAAVYTRVLNLTSEEAEHFWPIYNEYLDRREQAQQNLRTGKKLDLMSDAEVEDQIKRYFESRQKDIDLERDLYQRLTKVLPQRKIAKLVAAEREFRESIVQQIQQARQERKENRLNRRN